MVNFKEDENLKTLNHSCAHLMAQAVKHLYPDAKFWVGPVVAEGFYYDIDLGDRVIRDEDIAAIEKEMKRLQRQVRRLSAVRFQNRKLWNFLRMMNIRLTLFQNLKTVLSHATIREISQTSAVDLMLIM